MDLKKRYVIIVAGGSGSRMGASIPKQFILLNNEPILMTTVRRFYNFDQKLLIILVLPTSEIYYWQQLCIDYEFNIPHVVVKGGFTRFHSVRNALNEINEDCLVAIHDGVRPLVSEETINNCFQVAELTGSAIPVINSFESIRQVIDDKSIAIERSLYRLVQTPQVFKSEVLLPAYKQPYMTQFTDDASVVEHYGHTISLVEGNRDNIKITTPIDLLIAEALLKQI